MVEWQERIDALKKKQSADEEIKAEELRQAYLRRTGREFMKP